MKGELIKKAGSKLSELIYRAKCKIFPQRNRKKTLSSRKVKQSVFIVGMLSIAVVHFLLFWVYVNFNSILMAFQIKTAIGTEWGLDNFIRFFKEVRVPEYELDIAIKNTLLLFVTGTFISLPLSLLFGYYLFKKVLWSKFFRVVFFLPSIMSAAVLVALFKNIVALDGPLNEVLSFMLNRTFDISWVTDEEYSMLTILFYCIWSGFGANLVLLTGAIHRIPEDVLEYARLDGVGMARELVQIIIPMIWPTLSTLMIFATAGLFTNMGPVLLFTEGQHKTMTLGFFIFNKVKKFSQYEYPAAVGLIFTAIGLPIVLIVRKVLSKVLEDVEY